MSETMYKLQYELNIQTGQKYSHDVIYNAEMAPQISKTVNVEKTAAIIVRILLSMVCIFQIITNDFIIISNEKNKYVNTLKLKLITII